MALSLSSPFCWVQAYCGTSTGELMTARNIGGVLVNRYEQALM